MNKPSPYVKLASAEFAECRIERIFVRSRLRQTIRFSDWRGGRFHKRALDLSEDELLVLLGDAIAARVFSQGFVADLVAVLRARHGRDMTRVTWEILAFFAIWACAIALGFAVPQLFDRDVAGALASELCMLVGAVLGPVIAIAGIVALRKGKSRAHRT